MSEPENADPRAISSTHAALGAADRGELVAPALLPGETDADDQRLDDLLPLAISPLAATGPGRPKGSKNRRTDLVAQYLVDRFGDPLTASMATAGMPLRDLITDLRKVASDVGMKLGASVMDVARFQRDCRNDALPYIHAKRAPETAKGEPVLPVIGIGRFEQHNTIINGAAMTIEQAMEARAKEAKPIQQVIDAAPEMSHDEMSHGENSDDETTR